MKTHVLEKMGFKKFTREKKMLRRFELLGRRYFFPFHNSPSYETLIVAKVSRSRVFSTVSVLSPDDCFKQLANNSKQPHSSNRHFLLYNRLKELDALTTEAFELMMVTFKYKGDILNSIKLMNEFKTTSLPLSSNLYSCFLSILVDHPVRGFDEREIFDYLVKNYDSSKSSLINSANLFVNICILFCKHRNDKAVNILIDMISAHHEPSQQLCLDLLNVALLSKDVKVLRVLTGWYCKISSFNGYRLELGHLNRILEICGNVGDSALASTTIELMAKNSFSLNGYHYYSFLRTFSENGNLVAVVEALVDMQQKSIVFSNTYEVEELLLLQVRKLIVKMLLESTQQKVGYGFINLQMFDQIYFALSEHAKGGHKVPQVLLESLIEGYGKVGHGDKGLKVFHDVKPVFGMNYTVGLYNSLMAGCARRNSDSLVQVFEIFNEMKDFLSPNKETFSILVDCCIENEAYANLANLVNDESMVVQLSKRLLRNMARAFKSQGMKKELSVVMEKMHLIPIYSLQKKLDDNLYKS